jgi:hypothetical protein
MESTETKQNGTKPKQAKPTELKTDDLFFEIPLPADESLKCLTAYLQDKRGCRVTAVSFRVSDGRVMVGCLPE